MKTDFRSLSLGFMVFVTIYTFFLTQMGYSSVGYNFAIMFNYFNPTYVYHTIYNTLSIFSWNFLGYNIDYFQIIFSYILTPPVYIVSLFIGIGGLIYLLITTISIPFTIFPTPIYDLFTGIVTLFFVISFITSIQVVSTSLKGD
jgi:hypothetical protein